MLKKIIIGSIGLGLLAVFAGWVLLHGYFGPPVITVRNHSGILVEGPHLAGTGFAKTLPDLLPGRSITTVVRPGGESSLTISFNLKAQRLTSDCMTYLEPGGGYLVSIRIQPAGAVECQTATGFSWRRAV